MPAYDPDQHRIYFGAVDKRLYALDERGKRVRFWNTNAATTPVDGPSGGAGANVHIGGASGGESVWLADNNAVVYRLGPSDATVPALLPLAWLDDRRHRGSPLNPLASFYLPIADFQGKAVVVDIGHQITLLDPATGAGQSAGSIAGSKPIAPVEPVVAGSTLLTVSDTTLVATELPSGRALWTATGARSGDGPAPLASVPRQLQVYRGRHGERRYRLRRYPTERLPAGDR